MDPLKQEPTYEITIDSNRGTIAQVVLALVFCVVFIILDARHLVLGQVTRVSPIAILIAFFCFAAAIRSRDILLKVALVLIGIPGLTRFIIAQLHATYALRHLAAIGGSWLRIVGLMMVVFVIVQWLRSVIHRIPTADREDAIS